MFYTIVVVFGNEYYLYLINRHLNLKYFILKFKIYNLINKIHTLISISCLNVVSDKLSFN